MDALNELFEQLRKGYEVLINKNKAQSNMVETLKIEKESLKKQNQNLSIQISEINGKLTKIQKMFEEGMK